MAVTHGVVSSIVDMRVRSLKDMRLQPLHCLKGASEGANTQGRILLESVSAWKECLFVELCNGGCYRSKESRFGRIEESRELLSDF